MSLAKRDHATETLLLDRADEPLGIGVARWDVSVAAESAGHRHPSRISPTPRGYRGRGRGSDGTRSADSPSCGSVSVRASGSIHAPYGCGGIPAMVTRRVSNSSTKKTRCRVRPASVRTSPVHRSQAARPSPCACTHAGHGVRRARAGAGSIPWSCSIRVTVWPGDVVARDSRARHEVGHLAWRDRPASTAAGAAVVLPGNQPPVPAEHRLRRDDAGDLRQNPPAAFLASHRESTALGRRSGEVDVGQGAPGENRSRLPGGGSPSQRP